VIVHAPGSSANLGPGFDALGLAIDWGVDVGSADEELPERARWADDTHPAAVAHRSAGGDGRLWVRTSIPMGRGLGFSGAVRVAGAGLAVVERAGGDREAIANERSRILEIAAELDGHPDNVAASLYGGIVAVAGGIVVRIPCPLDASVVVWVPDLATRTDQSRTRLPADVAFGDAVFNVGRTALLVAALAAGDIGALRSATADRLHQDVRLAERPESRIALDVGLDHGAWCGWLSGSGPTVAFLAAPGDVDRLLAALPETGRARAVSIDQRGAVVVDAP
jgi:homoserine kinase